MAKRFRAAVIGGSGYGGSEMMRRLLVHPDVELARVASIDYVDEPLWKAHPNLMGLTDLRFERLSPAEAAEGCDVVLLALPHRVTAEKVPELLPSGVKVIDMSGDFRLQDAAVYEEFYGLVHPHPELLERFVYGLPELNREAIRGADYVACPGCFATTVELALLPLAKAGLLQGAIHTTAITGSSGSGAAPKPGAHHPVRAVNIKAYSPLTHRHVPEMVQAVRTAGATGELSLRFVPISGPLSRGILATTFVDVDAAVTTAQLDAIYTDYYAAHPFTRIPVGRLPEVAAVAGSNYAEVGFTLGAAVGGQRTLCLQSAIDNLIKGGAGQAIQNMNLALGLEETASLADPGSWP